MPDAESAETEENQSEDPALPVRARGVGASEDPPLSLPQGPPHMVEKKWRANADKVAFAKSFPGRLNSWEEAAGKKIDRVARVDGRSAGAVIFSDGTYLFIPSPDLEPADLIQVLLTARPFLEGRYREAYEGLDRRIAADRELRRMARLENIMGAIRNNLSNIPELRERLRRFLEEEAG